MNYVSLMVKMHETNETFVQQWVYILFTHAAILRLLMIRYIENNYKRQKIVLEMKIKQTGSFRCVAQIHKHEEKQSS